MGGGRKTKHGAEVAPIFRARREESSRGEDGREEDSDSAASDTSRTAAAAPLTKADLRHLLQEIKTNMAAEFSRHLTPITESLNDLTRRTTAIEDQLDRTSMQAQTNKTAISALQDQPQHSRNAWAFRPSTSPPNSLIDAQQEDFLQGARHCTRQGLHLPAVLTLNRPPKDVQMTAPLRHGPSPATRPSPIPRCQDNRKHTSQTTGPTASHARRTRTV
ncbi:Hypothetical predicted protein [Pelobates cultripes]|uniref:Uncharacterized protein n=1 Tax=Pelobates cultripes TaxID=61616 RepID=A0AAD1SR83_PELCU|nr:Hypothetical predicted protein [Pelobates cultripes]